MGKYQTSETVHDQMYTALEGKCKNIQLIEKREGDIIRKGRAGNRSAQGVGIEFGSEWLQVGGREPVNVSESEGKQDENRQLNSKPCHYYPLYAIHSK